MSRTDDEIESVRFHTSLAKRASAIIVREAHAELNFACLRTQSPSGSQCSRSNHCGKPLSSIQRSIFAHHVALHQKSTRALISMVRDALTVLVILPKVVELMFVFGTFHWGLLRMFNASARSVNMVFSVRRRRLVAAMSRPNRSEEHTSELQSLRHLVCRLLLEKKKKNILSHFDYQKKKKKNESTHY